MTVRTDLDINRSVRTILVRHWIDLGRISIRSSKGKVWIYGELHRIEGTREPLTTPIVERIFYDIRRLPEVRMVTTQIENWICESGSWRPAAGQAKKTEDSGKDTTDVDSVF
jgi:hypothetical protein